MQVTFKDIHTQEILAQAEINLDDLTIKLDLIAQGSFEHISAVCEDEFFFFRIEMLVKTRKSIGIFSTGRGIEISTAESDEFFIEDDEDLDI
jgi:hypothetical protein